MPRGDGGARAGSGLGSAALSVPLPAARATGVQGHARRTGGCRARGVGRGMGGAQVTQGAAATAQPRCYPCPAPPAATVPEAWDPASPEVPLGGSGTILFLLLLLPPCCAPAASSYGCVGAGRAPPAAAPPLPPARSPGSRGMSGCWGPPLSLPNATLACPHGTGRVAFPAAPQYPCGCVPPAPEPDPSIAVIPQRNGGRGWG